MDKTYYRRPEILASPGLERGHAIIEASAGTGKTFTLEHLVLDLMIREEANIEEILVVTFTDAATRELRERVRALIRKICDEDTVDPESETGTFWEIDEAVRGRLREALFRFDGAAISTIHGFCQRILSEQAFLGGRLFEQQHIDGAEIFGLAFREEARSGLAEQSSVGKALGDWITRGSTLQELEDLLYRCHREGSPQRCPVTPTWDPQGLNEIISRFPPYPELDEAGRELLNDKKTYNAYKKHLDSLFETIGAMQAASEPQDAVTAFMKWAEKERSLANVKRKQFDFLKMVAEQPLAPQVIINMAKALRRIAERAAPQEAFFVHELLPRVQERLSARKRSLGLIDYDDLLLGVQEALAGTDSETLLSLLRERWKYALVDEFQDTDAVQWDIFRRIFVDGTSAHRLFIIGDPKQAIYGFRGADVHTYDSAKKHLTTERGASRLPLTKNYRSTKALIESLNYFFTAKDESDSSFFSGLNRYDEPVECGDNSLTALEGGKFASPVHLIRLDNEGKKLTASRVRKGLACFISEEILSLVDKNDGLVTVSKEREPAPLKLNDIYILTRTGTEGHEIGEVLRSYNIPHAFYKQDGLFETEEANNIHRLLCAIDSPANPGIRMSAWLTPFFDLPLEELPAWQEAGLDHPLTALLMEWKKLADDHSWSNLFDRVISSSGLIRRLIFSGNERALTNYLHIFELLQAEAYSCPITLAELARSLKARIDGRKTPEGREGDIQRLETDKEAVQILTMHKAKGLEAEVVFIAGGFGKPRGRGIKMEIYHHDSERRLHIGKAVGEIADLIEQENNEENERLAYVALTRAKSRLYLPYFGSDFNTAGTFCNKLQKQLDLLEKQDLLSNKNNFLIRRFSCLRLPQPEKNIMTEQKNWPPQELLDIPRSSAGEAEKLEPAHRGILLTSYTRMSQGKGWQAPAADIDQQEAKRDEEVAGEVDDTILELPQKGTTRFELPGGRETGLFLHSLLERIPPGEIGEKNLVEWSSSENLRDLTAATARRHGFNEDFVPEALRLAYNAYKNPLYSESREEGIPLAMPGGIASGLHHCAEVSFTYPIPETFHPLLSAHKLGAAGAADLPYKAVRGYLQGLIDLIFEHEEKIYLLDWKSDRLPFFDPESLDNHVSANYSLQAQVYTLAVVRMLDIKSEEKYNERFGGIIYSFIRGIRPADKGHPADGIWFSLPPWPGIALWENQFLERQDWGGDVIQLNTN